MLLSIILDLIADLDWDLFPKYGSGCDQNFWFRTQSGSETLIIGIRIKPLFVCLSSVLETFKLIPVNFPVKSFKSFQHSA